jgi:hypothetical protein
MATTPDPADLTTVADLAAWLSLVNVDQPTSDRLQKMVTAASLFIQQVISRTIRSLAYSETRDGHGGNRMVLANGPVTAVSSVLIDGVSIPASTSPATLGYIFTPTALVLRGYTFTTNDCNIQVSYTAGFAQTPPDLAQACLELAALRWKERDHIGHVSKNFGSETVTFLVKDMPDSVRTILNQYKAVVPV